MGWDITYHPISKEEVHSIYFKGLQDLEHYKTIASQFGMDDFYTEQLKSRFAEARTIEKDLPFNKGHAFYIAIISGFLRKHHYLRGAAFSFLADDKLMSRYVSDWKQLVPEDFKNCVFDNRLTENYCGGVFLSNEALKALRSDYSCNSAVRDKLDDVFSHGRLDIFWRAVDDAIENDLALVEATEIVEPNPLDLNSTRSLTNLFNCYPDGALLYAEASLEQLAQIESMTEPVTQEKKKGFFTRLFGR